MVGNSNDETNFRHKLLLMNTQVSKILKAFANGSSATIKFSPIQWYKIVKPGGFIFGSPIEFMSPDVLILLKE